jgi:hypothetical protein
MFGVWLRETDFGWPFLHISIVFHATRIIFYAFLLDKASICLDFNPGVFKGHTIPVRPVNSLSPAINYIKKKPTTMYPKPVLAIL